MFGLGPLLYTVILLLNAVAILSNDRFLARIGWSARSYDPAFGQGPDQSVKGKIITLITSVHTIMRGALVAPNTSPLSGSNEGNGTGNSLA
ncbi:unnamed protein product [Discula destructiva]